MISRLEHAIMDVSTHTMATSATKDAATNVLTVYVMMGLKDAVSNADLRMLNFKDASKHCAYFDVF